MRSYIPGSRGNGVAILAVIEKEQPRETLPPEAERSPYAQWATWLGHSPRIPKPPLRIVLVLDNRAWHLSYDLVEWFFKHGVMPLYTPVGGRCLEHPLVGATYYRAACPGWPASKDASRDHRLVRANRGGLESEPNTPMPWNGKRRKRRERARFRRLARSAAAIAKGYAIAS